MKITTTTITDVTYPPGPFRIDAPPTYTKKPVVIVDGIADVEPSALDYFGDSLDTVGELATTAWVFLPHQLDNTQRLIPQLHECTEPDLRVRWTLHQTLRALRQAANDLEKHIAKHGLWISTTEFYECDDGGMKSWGHEEFRRNHEAWLAEQREKWPKAEAAKSAE